MSTPAQDPQAVLAVALAKLEGAVSTGFAETKGSLALLVQRAGQTDEQLKTVTSELAEHDRRINRLEREVTADEEVERARRRRMSTWGVVAGVVVAVATVVGTALAVLHP
ncbi:hypothetical protein ACPC54_23360 [Kitasatospora sp. NPDC094028]